MSLLRIVCAVLLATVAGTAHAAPAADAYPAGKFYTLIDNSVPPDPQHITVQEFFWYGCPHCFRLEPLVDKWSAALPKDVVYERVPDALGQAVGAVHQKAYYVEQVTGTEARLHMPLFDAIQIQRLPLTNEAALRAFFIKNGGMTGTRFDDAWSGFTVDSKVRRADQLASQYRIMAVPAIVIDGQYKLEGGLPGYAALAGSETDRYKVMLKVADTLIEKTRQQRGAGK